MSLAYHNAPSPCPSASQPGASGEARPPPHVSTERKRPAPTPRAVAQLVPAKAQSFEREESHLILAAPNCRPALSGAVAKREVVAIFRIAGLERFWSGF